MKSSRQAVPAEPARVFIALWPDAPTVSAMLARCSGYSDDPQARIVTPERVHLTMQFLGNVPQNRLPELVSALRVPFTPFTLGFSHCAHWPGGLLVMVPDAVVPTLKQLYLALGQALHGLGLPVEQRPFQPHLTLARRHLRPLTPCDAAPLLWHVDHYVLVQSQATKQHAYRVLQEYACA